MTTALYRRYRPETFADVIGQEHVTEPLMAALRGDRVTHAYLFSGPRGCGKTTSARILARCLNCVQGPTDTPCGVCDSCVELARGGSGSLDVVEIDAASHNGVDDARELRERAAFAPARDRYKVFILDEAHMVTTQGFNALLKIVEEPPPHVKFVFATTEPDKVIGTIRSRTHHYPFRLVPPERLTAYLEQISTAEGIEVAGGVLPLVVRAGGGSVRDSLSVLDQLIAGATGGEVTYERAVALLGFTHGALLDDAVDALAARDGGSLFRVVEHVIDSGHAPRRFVEDLLERLRDLIVVLAAGEQAGSVLRAVPADQLERMRSQAQHLGSGQLSRAADLVNEALMEMTGATSPRLQLELLCARLLLPAADDDLDSFGARLDRLEVALSSGAVPPRADGPAPAAPPVSAPPPVPPPVVQRAGDPASDAATSTAPAPWPSEPSPPEARRASAQQGADAAGATSARPAGAHAATQQAGAAAAASSGAVAAGQSGAAEVGPSAAEPVHAGDPGGRAAAGTQPPAAASEAATGSAGMTADQVRRRWPEVLETLKRIKRTTWTLISQDAQVVDLGADTLSLGFSTRGLASAFRKGPHTEPLQRALSETLGLTVRIDAVVVDGAAPAATPPSTSQRAAAPESDAVARATADWGDTPAGSRPAGPRRAEGSSGSRASGDASAADNAQAPSDPQKRTSQNPATPWDTRGETAADPRRRATAGAGLTDAQSEEPRPDPDRPPPWDIPAGASSGGHARAEATPGGDTPAGASDDQANRSGRADGPGGGAASDTTSGQDEGDSDDPGSGGTRPDAPPPGRGPHGAGAEQPGARTPSGSTAGEASPCARRSSYEEHGGRGDDDIPPAEPPDDPYAEAQPVPAGMSARDAAFAAARRHTTSPQAAHDVQATNAAHATRAPHMTHAPPSDPAPDEHDHPDPSDPDLDGSGLVGAPLVARLLGGTVIDEITEHEAGR